MSAKSQARVLPLGTLTGGRWPVIPPSIQRQIAKIRTIGCIDELDAYEAAAKARGIEADEMAALNLRRRELTGSRR